MSHIFEQFCAPLKRRPPAVRGRQGLSLRHCSYGLDYLLPQNLGKTPAPVALNDFEFIICASDAMQKNSIYMYNWKFSH